MDVACHQCRSPGPPSAVGPVGAALVLDAILATAVDQAILAVDETGRITLASAGAEGLLGYRYGSLAGHDLAEVLRPPAGQVEPGLAGLLEAGGVDGPRMRTLVRQDGTELPALMSVGELLGATGQLAGAVVVAWEVRGERRAADAMRRAFEREHAAAERLRELSRIKDDFVANVSHELRTPLTTVVGNTEMLLDGDAGALTPAQQRLLGAVDRNARRLHTLVGDLLTLSRIQNGQVSLTSRPVVLQEIVERALRATAVSPATQALRVDVVLHGEPLVVDGDPDELARMVGNVVGNAVKFTPTGGLVTVRLGTQDTRARIEVTDTGVGIPADEIGLVFDGFFRSSRSRRDERPGTGLGLTIARSIADRHGGAIQVTAREPAGTAVVIELPLARS